MCYLKQKYKPGFFGIHEQISFAAAISCPILFFFAHWNLGKYADAGFFADKVDRGQKSVFFLASSALGYKHWDRGEKRSIHPERNSTHLGIWVVRINTCIGLIIKDSPNEDRCYPLKARWFHKPDLNSDVVVITVPSASLAGRQVSISLLYLFRQFPFYFVYYVIHFPCLR